MRQDPRFKDGCWEPAMLQLPVGEIQLFFSDEGIYTKTDEQNISMLRSFDNEAKNFGQVSTPFPEPEGFHALWNSLCFKRRHSCGTYFNQWLFTE